MKLAIMQPYFFPYIGYFQLINAVDKFIIYDNVEFTKKGWINRNKLLFEGKEAYFTINIKKDSDFLDVVEREISPTYFKKEMPKIIRKIKQNYKRAPYFEFVYPVIEDIFLYEETNLFNYIFNSIKKVIEFLEIETELIVSSSIPIDHSLKNKYRIFAFCEYFNIFNYINPIGGKKIYTKEEFAEKGIDIKFLSTNKIEYKQFGDTFVPNLSIIDIMFFNSKERIQELLKQYKLT